MMRMRLTTLENFGDGETQYRKIDVSKVIIGFSSEIPFGIR